MKILDPLSINAGSNDRLIPFVKAGEQLFQD
jgi:hypothetical protein